MVSFPRFEPWGQIVVGQVSLDELLAHKGWLLAVASLLPEVRCKASDVGAGSSAAGLPFFRGMR